MIQIDDYLGIAARVLGMSAQAVTNMANLSLAESALHAPFAGFGDVEFYPDPIEKAAILCSRLARNHPLPLDGNKRSAYLALLMFLDMNGIEWNPPSEDERVATMEAVAEGSISEPDFIEWLRARTTPAE